MTATKENKLCIVGHFAGKTPQYDGQTIKTRELYNQLVKKIGKNNVNILDTYNWKKNPIKFFLKCIGVARANSDIIILPSTNGIKVLLPLFNRLKKIYKNKTHYVVIGNWVCELLKHDKSLLKTIKNIDYIYLESHKSIESLQKLGVKKCYYMRNFKDLDNSPLASKHSDSPSLNCCIFSRIEKEKGILDAIDVINRYNSKHTNKIILDIYGKIKDNFKSEFESAISENKDISYKKPINPKNSVAVISEYDLLLFPTKYKTEGIPGTIIDAFFSGVPVLASKWNNFDEIITEGETGFGYNFGDTNDFYEKLVYINNNRHKLKEMRKNCLKESSKYTPEVALSVLLNNLGSK